MTKHNVMEYMLYKNSLLVILSAFTTGSDLS